MPGTDTSRGMNFQYACSIGLLIDFYEHPEWEIIQFEGDQDIEDVVIFNKQHETVFRAQIKQKKDPYQWTPHEFRNVISKFANLDKTENTTINFLYSGADGKSIIDDIKPVLYKIKYRGWDSLLAEEIQIINKLLDETCAEFLKDMGNRFEVIKRESWRSIKLEDLRRISIYNLSITTG